jgi:N4-gp56 family major capsid protein
MANQLYTTQLSRNLIRAAQGMLEHAQPIIVLGDFGEFREMPQNSTDTLVFRRTLPFGAVSSGSGIGGNQYIGTPNITPTQFVLAEGVTPNSNTISFQDVTVTLQNFGVLFKLSSKVESLYEDDVPAEMVKLVGETLGEVQELVRYGVFKAGTQVVYANGSSRGAVNSPISINKLRQTARNLEANRAKRVTQRLSPSVNFGTLPVAPAFIVFCHTDAEADVRNLPKFTRVEEYGSFKPIHEREIGACEQFRFITSPLLSPFLAAGSANINGMVSIGNANVDVYPFLVLGEQAWGQVALKGMNALTPTVLPAKERNHANPLGMFGFVGASFWFNAVRVNEAWCARIEAAVSAL